MSEDQGPADGLIDDEVFSDAAKADFAAGEEARFFASTGRRRISRRFVSILALVLLAHVALLAAFLLRDRRQTMQVAELQETPVEVVVEQPEPPKPPAPPKPPEQKPEPPRPKEDLSPAMSAPRAPTEEKLKTETKEAKTQAPTHTATPTQGAPQAAAPAAAPAKEATPEVKKEEAAKEEDKREAEALDKAKRKQAKKQARTREAKTSPQKINPNLLAALGGAPDFGAKMTFARPTPKTKIYGGTEDVRWMSEVEAMLEAKVQQLPRTAHYQAGGKVALCFHVSPDGRVLLADYCMKSGYPDVDQLAMRALRAAQPFPPPPPGLDRGLIWISTFDGQVPVLHFR